MKRIKVAIILLVFSALICTTEFLYVTTKADDITSKIEEIENAYTQCNTSKALEITEDVQMKWKASVSKMDMLLYHDYIDTITSNIEKLEILIYENDSTSLLCTCKETTLMLESLKNSEYPTAENII